MENLAVLRNRFIAAWPTRTPFKSTGAVLNKLLKDKTSRFFIELYQEIEKTRIVAETFIKDFFIRERFSSIQKHGGFMKMPALSYLRLVTLQDGILSTITA